MFKKKTLFLLFIVFAVLLLSKYDLNSFDNPYNDKGTSKCIHSASYATLVPGDNSFLIQATKDSKLKYTHATIKLVIKSHWWSTWWAYICYSALLFSILLLVRNYEIGRLRLKNQLRLNRVETDSLRNIDKSKSRFFANISHEFRTPLTLILGQVESVMSSGIETKEKAKLLVANRNARKLLSLINQLLDLSKIEAGSMELHPSQHNIVSFLKSLFFSFESMAASRKVKQLFYSDSNIINVVFDPDMMEKVFSNVVSNAFKFTEANGEVRVNIRSVDSLFVEISIEDSGTGIPADQLPNIFDRFFQADTKRTRKFDGSGIGLSLAKELVELHQGTITADSREGEGTVIVIRLPLVNIKMQPRVSDNHVSNVRIENFDLASYEMFQKEEISSINAVRANKEIILIVEDNSDVQSYINEQLEKDYRILLADNGNSGIHLARETVPDLIITDLMMPEMDGYQLCEEIRKDERTSHIPVIMLTAKAGFDDKMKGLETGIDDFITKPFSTRELKVRIRNLIDQRKQLRKRFSTSTIISPIDVSGSSVDQVFLGKVVAIIVSHFEDQYFTTESLAQEVNMSVSQLNRKLNALIDQPAGQLMRSLCLQRAADLLKNKTGTVAEICYRLCFNDQAYFSRAFKKQFGCSPSEYVKN